VHGKGEWIERVAGIGYAENGFAGVSAVSDFEAQKDRCGLRRLPAVGENVGQRFV
jgi:hypothetical protein